MAGKWLTPDTAAETTREITITVPDDEYLYACLLGAVFLLAMPDNWEFSGEKTPEEIAAVFMAVLDSVAENA